MITTQPCSNFEPMRTMLVESISTKVILSAVELKLFDFTEAQPIAPSTLARQLGVIPDRLECVLELLTAVDLLSKESGKYRNTTFSSEFLVSESPLYQGDNIELIMKFNNAIEDSITRLLFSDNQRDKTDNEWAVTKAMEGCAQEARSTSLLPVTEFVTGLPDFTHFSTMGDIGGNHGLYSMAILEKNSKMQGTIFDLPPVAELAQKRCNAAGFKNRIATCGIDLRNEQLPLESFDLLLSSHVLYAFKNNLHDTLAGFVQALTPGGWFVSHHYSGLSKQGNEQMKASLELLTRFSGYPSHFIEQEDLTSVLADLGLINIRCQPVSQTGTGLLIAAQKPQ